jgi:hypothetical protein
MLFGVLCIGISIGGDRIAMAPEHRVELGVSENEGQFVVWAAEARARADSISRIFNFSANMRVEYEYIILKDVNEAGKINMTGRRWIVLRGDPPLLTKMLEVNHPDVRRLGAVRDKSTR